MRKKEEGKIISFVKENKVSILISIATIMFGMIKSDKIKKSILEELNKGGKNEENTNNDDDKS